MYIAVLANLHRNMRSYSRLTREKSRKYALERNYSDIIVVSTANQFHILQGEREQMSGVIYNDVIIVSTCYKKHT